MIGGWKDTEMCGGMAEALSAPLEDDLFAAARTLENVDVSESAFENLSPGGLRRCEIAIGLGISIGVHTVALVVAALATLFLIPPCTRGASYITVCMIGPAGAGEGSEAGSKGSSNDSAGPPAQSGESSASVGAAVIFDSNACDLPAPDPTEEAAAEETKVTSEPATQHIPESAKLTQKPKKAPARKNEKKTANVDDAANERSRKGEAPIASLSQGAPHEQSLEDGKANGSGGGQREGSGGAGVGSGAGFGGVPEELDSKQVDVPPTAIRKVDPEFPHEARKMGLGGRVVLKLLVKKDGSVGKATVIEAAPQGIFERSALEAIEKWRFNPGRYRGMAVAVWVVQPIHFRLIR